MYEARQNKEKVSRIISWGNNARQKVKTEDIIQRFIMKKKDIKRHFPVLQKVRIATNIDCPSWGNASALGSYIHGLFQTQFLSMGGGGFVAPAFLMPNRAVEMINPNGGISDFAEFFPGAGVTAYAELKPNNNASIARGANQMRGLPFITNLALPGMPLDAIDPQAQPQGLGAFYTPVQNVNAPAPQVGNIPYVYFFATGANGVYAYDAW